MSKAHQLPFEILSSIFQAIGPKDCQQCSLTCTSWNAAARPFIFKRLRNLTDQKMDKLRAFPTHNSKLQPFQNFVKIFSIERLSDEFCMELLHSAFPSTEEIKLKDFENTFLEPHNNGKVYYNKHLAILHGKICQVIAKGGFPKLKKIPLLNYDKMHWNLVTARRKSIEWLQIIENSQNGELINCSLRGLDQFPRLKTFLAFMKSNKSIESLFPGGLTAVTTIDLAFKSPFRPVFDNPLLNVQPLGNVKSVKIRSQCLYADGNNFFLFIMRKFPDLENLVLDGMEYSKFFPRLRRASFSPEVLSKFFLYLTSIKSHFQMRFGASQEATAKAIYIFLKLAPEQHFHSMEKLEIRLDVSFENDDVPLRNNCSLDYSRHTKIYEVEMNYAIGFEDHTAFLPFLRMMKSLTGANIVSLSLEPEEDSKVFESTSIPVDKILQYCTNLKTFVIKSAPEISLSKLPAGFVSGVQKLNFTRCTMYGSFFQAIDLHCPQLKKLELDGCSYLDCNDPLDPHSFTSYRIDMPSISLDELYFSPKYFKQFPYLKTFIKVSTATTKPRYCKLKWNLPYYGDGVFLIIGKAQYTEKDYKAAIRGNCKVYTVHCKAVTEFAVKTIEDGNRHKNVFR